MAKITISIKDDICPSIDVLNHIFTYSGGSKLSWNGSVISSTLNSVTLDIQSNGTLILPHGTTDAYMYEYTIIKGTSVHDGKLTLIGDDEVFIEYSVYDVFVTPNPRADSITVEYFRSEGYGVLCAIKYGSETIHIKTGSVTLKCADKKMTDDICIELSNTNPYGFRCFVLYGSTRIGDSFSSGGMVLECNGKKMLNNIEVRITTPY
jgi:hypothetical protein